MLQVWVEGNECQRSVCGGVTSCVSEYDEGLPDRRFGLVEGHVHVKESERKSGRKLVVFQGGCADDGFRVGVSTPEVTRT